MQSFLNGKDDGRIRLNVMETDAIVNILQGKLLCGQVDETVVGSNVKLK